MRGDYHYDFDDPYKMLAHTVIAQNSVANIHRILEDDEYVERLVLKETRLQDFSGAFVDCIVQSILDGKRRMELMHELDKLSKFFYANLDKERLRAEILKYGKRYDIL